MAINDGAYLSDTWENLKQNPVFSRSMMPRGLRIIWRSPIVRAVLLSFVGMAMFHVVYHVLHLGYLFTAVSAALLWTMIYSVQHYLCWVELMAMSASGTLQDYLNSGLSREDVAMGLIYPARISENIASIMILVYFLVTADKSDQSIMTLLVVITVMRVAGLFRPPTLFLPDAENYLRKRNPVALFLISFSIFVPLLIWFSIFYSLYLAASLVAVMAKATNFSTIYVVVFIATIYISRVPNNWFAGWRLKQFYKRQSQFGDLFEKYVEAR